MAVRGDAFLALVRARLEALRPRAIEALRELPREGYPADMVLYLEIEVGALSKGFPVALVVDAGPGASRGRVDLPDPFAGFPALLTREELDRFAVTGDGSGGALAALGQPATDPAHPEALAILPWIIAIWAEAGLTDLPVEAVAGLHDTGRWSALTRTKATLPDHRGRAPQPRKVPEHPLKLGARAARLGAAAFAVGALFFVWPVYQGYQDAQARLASDPAICGQAAPAGEEEAALRVRVADYFVEICEERP